MLAIAKRGLNLLVLGLCLVPAITAIYESEAGIFDWHHKWVGHPREAVSIDKQHIAIYSDRNVIASLDTKTGAVAWRQVLDNELDQFVASPQGILTLSSNPERAQMWNTSTGSLIYEYTLNPSQVFGSTNPLVWTTGESAFFIDRTQLVKLSTDGQLVWTWTRNSDKNAIYERIKLVERGAHTFVIVEPDEESKHPQFDITVLHSETGEKVDSFVIKCKKDFDNVAYVGNYVLWTEGDAIKYTLITDNKVKTASLKKLVSALPTASKFLPERINLGAGNQDASLTSFLLSTEDENMDEQVEIASLLIDITEEGLAVKKDFGVQTAYGGIDFHGSSLVRTIKTSATEFTAYVLPEQKQLSISHDFSLSGEINYAKLISLEPFELLVVTEGSSVYYYNESGEVWSREEALSNIAKSEFLDLPEQKMWTQMVDELDETKQEQEQESSLVRYVKRLTTHILQLRQLPNYVINRLTPTLSATTKVTAQESQTCWKRTDNQILYRDNFGFRKLLISVTKSGKIIAQDSRGGKIIWSRYVPGFSFTDLHIIRAASIKLPPLIVAIGETVDEVGGQATGLIRINALTGQDYNTAIASIKNFFEPIVATNIGTDKIMRLPIEDPDERTQLLAIYEQGSGRVYIYPDTESARSKFASEFLPTFYFSYQKEDGTLQGFKVVEGYRHSLKVMPVWEFKLPTGEHSLATSKPQVGEKVASLGRVLGNRNVLYKYLNPHMFAVITEMGDDIKVRIMDAVKGSILYETIHHQVDAITNPVHIIQSENWFVYHFWSNESKPRGYQTVVLELFEGVEENERIASNNFSSFDHIQPHVLSSAFAFPYPVSTIGVTETRNGISTKDILFATPNQLFGVNKRLLDPRRPREKPTKEDQEEMLFPYAPIPDEKRLFLTYHLDVVGINTIKTSPSLLESTALVFAYGLDTFLTKSSPSKQFDVLSEDFSKAQLVLTMVGLVVSIYVTGPMVRRKRVNALWK